MPSNDFPDVPGWTKTGRREFGTADLGYSVGYDSGETAVTVYVYTAGAKDIPPGIHSGLVTRHFAQAKSDVFKWSKEHDDYRSVEPLADTVVRLGADGGKVEFRKAVFKIELQHGPLVMSQLYLTGAHGRFVKIRVTPRASNTDDESQVATLLEAVATSIGGAAQL